VFILSILLHDGLFFLPAGMPFRLPISYDARGGIN